MVGDPGPEHEPRAIERAFGQGRRPALPGTSLDFDDPAGLQSRILVDGEVGTMTELVLASIVALLLAGCTPAHVERGRSGQRRSSDVASGDFVRPGAPPVRGCAADAECRPGPFVNPENGCCDTGVHRGVFSAAYLEWRGRWVREHCGRVACPPIAPPSPVLPCALEGQCVAGQCQDRCGPPRGGSRAAARSRRCAPASGASDQDRLTAAARCFHDAVTALQREPASGETLAAFLGAAGLADQADLAFADGAIIIWQVVGRDHDDLEGGGATFTTTYRFGAPGHPETAETTVSLEIDGAAP